MNGGRLCCAVLTCCLLLAPGAVYALDSLAEAYLEQGKRLYDRGDLDGAKTLFNRSAVHAVRTYDSPLHMASIFNNAGEVYRKLVEIKGRDSSPSKEEQETAVVLRDVRTADPLDNSMPFASPEWMAHRYLKLALEIKEQELGTFSLDVARSMENLAALYMELDRSDEAEALLRKTLKIRETKEGMQSPTVTPVCYRLGKVLKDGSYRHADDNAKIAMLKDAISNFQRAKSGWAGAKSNNELLAATDQQLSFCNYLIWKENGQLSGLDKSERHYDEAYSRYAKESTRLKKRFDEFKRELRPMLQDSEDYWSGEVTKLLRSDGSLPVSAGDELVRLMKAARRLGDEGMYKSAQDQYNRNCSTQKASSK